jgi:steroid 5-alpha reductase family enzyme
MAGLTLIVLVLMTAVMLAAWTYGLREGNGGWTDVFWTLGTGGLIVGATLFPVPPAAAPDARQWLVAALVAVWSLRLGTYVARRVASHAEDVRYARFREDWGRSYPLKMLWVTLPQAPVTALLALSVLAAARRPGEGPDLRDLLGAAVFAVAIAGETLADAQLKRFKADPANRGKVAETGLWAWSRHPNYFFEWLVWLALPVMALDPARPASWLTLLAPAVMFGLLNFVSGVPPLEQAQLRSKGDAYRAYQARVSAFFPLPPKGRAA